jgi:hypothetical protein
MNCCCFQIHVLIIIHSNLTCTVARMGFQVLRLIRQCINLHIRGIFPSVITILIMVIIITGTLYGKEPDDKDWVFTVGAKTFRTKSTSSTYYNKLSADFLYSFESFDVNPEFFVNQHYQIQSAKTKKTAAITARAPGLSLSFYPSDEADIGFGFQYLTGAYNYRSFNISADAGYTFGDLYLTGGVDRFSEKYQFMGYVYNRDLDLNVEGIYSFNETLAGNFTYDFDTYKSKKRTTISTGRAGLDLKLFGKATEISPGLSAGTNKKKKFLRGLDCSFRQKFLDYFKFTASYSFSNYGTKKNQTVISSDTGTTHNTHSLSVGLAMSY